LQPGKLPYTRTVNRTYTRFATCYGHLLYVTLGPSFCTRPKNILDHGD